MFDRRCRRRSVFNAPLSRELGVVAASAGTRCRRRNCHSAAPPLPLVGESTGMDGGGQRDDSLADGDPQATGSSRRWCRSSAAPPSDLASGVQPGSPHVDVCKNLHRQRSPKRKLTCQV